MAGRMIYPSATPGISSLTAAEFSGDTPPDVVQRQATNPKITTWVNASAGTGKTSVLVKRYLRLLLPDPDRILQHKDSKNLPQGSPPDRILCLTFTKAAAAEMVNRITSTLSGWAVMADTDLEANLQDLYGEGLPRPALPSLMQAARQLFAATTDTEGGMKIRTLHSFCQSVLGRFPLEAGVPIGFEVADDTVKRQLQTNVWNTFLQSCRTGNASLECISALNVLRMNTSEVSFGDDEDGGQSGTLRSKVFKALSLCPQSILEQPLQTVVSAYGDALGLPENWYNPQDIEAVNDTIILEYLSLSQDRGEGLRALTLAVENSKAKAADDMRDKIYPWLDGRTLSTIQNGVKAVDKFESIRKIFLKADSTFRKPLKEINNKAALIDIWEGEGRTALETLQKLAILESATYSRSLIILLQILAKGYIAAKAKRSFLDYDDLIEKTLRLLSRSDVSEWILYKLDGGLDHILVDEAQDTSRKQWDLISYLTGDFFSGDTARNTNENPPRTLFVVGDEKQSIYGFQGADPAYYLDQKAHIKSDVEQGGEQFQTISMTRSFRSTGDVLQMVDAVFSKYKDGVVDPDAGTIHHIAHSPAHGAVEVWPLLVKEKGETDTLTKMIERPYSDKPSHANAGHADTLADRIAHSIRCWIDSGLILHKTGRALEASDVMILVRKRRPLVEPILKALHRYQVPASGIDRMVLADTLAVQDLLALAEISLLREDDYTLACVLKSPFIGLREAVIFDLCHKRSGTVWQNLQQKAIEGNTTSPYPWAEIFEYLTSLQHLATRLRPYNFFRHILLKKCPLKGSPTGEQVLYQHFGLEVLEPLEIFVDQVLSIESKYPTSTLQSILNTLKTSAESIKREIETDSPIGVRVMTVHGAKGLQAPLVIIADNNSMKFSIGTDTDPLVLESGSYGFALPLWKVTGAAKQYQKIEYGYSIAEDLYHAENRRLFYVAMTRAVDRLVICAACSQNTSSNQKSWHAMARNSLEILQGSPNPPLSLEVLQAENLPDDSAPALAKRLPEGFSWFAAGGFRFGRAMGFASAQTDAQTIETLPKNDSIFENSPEWLWQAARPEIAPYLPLSATTPPRGLPQKTDTLEQSLETLDFLPITTATIALYQPPQIFRSIAPHKPLTAQQRGTFIHSLLQYLPNVHQEKWSEAAKVLARNYDGIQDGDMDSLLAEAMAVIQHPACRHAFGRNSRAEVPIAGLVGNIALSQRLDRLCIGTDSIWCLEYKTRRPAADTLDTVPTGILTQVALYEGLLRQMFPEKTVHCTLVWTSSPSVMPVPSDVLEGLRNVMVSNSSR